MKTFHREGGMRYFELLLVAALMFTGLTSVVGRWSNQSREVRAETLRLHIIANSDSDFDQNLKLKVRDKILSDTGMLFAEVTGKTEAEKLAETSLDDIQASAESVLASAGVDYPVSVELTDMWFETRSYDGFTLPAGNYDAIRIVIGEGEGVNWWCVMYPPLCVTAAEDAAALYGENAALVKSSSGVEIRFAVIELLEKLKAGLGI